MDERQFAFLVIKIGYIQLTARGIILLAFLLKYKGIPKELTIRPLFWWTTISLLIALFEVSFIGMVNTFTDFFLPYLELLNIHDTYFISPLFYITDLIFLGPFFINIIYELNTRKILLMVNYALIILEIINTIYWEGFRNPQRIGSFLLAFYIIILSVLFFQKYFFKKVASSLIHDAFNLIVWGFFSMSSFSILIYYFSDKLFKDFPILFYQVSIFRMFVEILSLIMVAAGINKLKVNRKKIT